MVDSGPYRLSLLERVLARLADAACSRPRLFVWPQVLLAAGAAVYTVFNLEFHTNRNDLVGSNKKYHNTFLKFLEEFPLQDDLVVMAESEDLEKNRQFVARLGARLEQDTEHFRGVFYRRDLRTLGSKTLLMASAEDLRRLRAELKEYQPFIRTFARATNLVSFVRLMNARFRAAASGQDTADRQTLERSLPALQKIMQQARAAILLPGAPPPPGMGAFMGDPEAEQEMHISFAHGRIFLVVAHPPSREMKAASVERMYEHVAAVQREIPGVNAGVTGEPVLEYDEMRQSRLDTTRAAVLALFLVALIFGFGYHESGRPLKATACLLVGLAYTMAYATAVVGHLNILTITFAPILIGLAIDFGVHLVTRYEEELRGGQAESEALRRALVRTGRGIFTGCLTTAAAFLAMGLTEFRGIREMGIIVGGGLVIALVPMMTMLPALLLRGRQNVLDHEMAGQVDTRARLEGMWLRRPVGVTLATLVLCVGAVPLLRQVGFDYNLLNLQTRGLPAVAAEKKLINSATNSVLYAAVVAPDLDTARRLETQLRQRPTVADVKSLVPLLDAEAADEKLATIRDIRDTLGDVNLIGPDQSAVSVDELKQDVFYMRTYFKIAAKRLEAEGEVELAIEMNALILDVNRLLELLVDNPVLSGQQLGRFQRAMFTDVDQTLRVLREQQPEGGIGVDDLPASLRNRFVGATGKLLLQVYPRNDLGGTVWDRPVQERFVKDVRQVSPAVTGTPVQLYEYTGLLVDSYLVAAGYALGAIVLMVLLHFRSLMAVFLALLPVAVGVLWMTAVMRLTGVPFNPANIMTLPLVIGVGVTSGVHILNRFAEEQNPAILGRSTGKAILVSAFTTVAGFGSLMIAKHQGIESLGIVMAVGTVTCMLAALVFLPAVISLLIGRGWRLHAV
ncbi:MAG: MMPL family transporter [Verrucomicrobiota bacterium]|nr:MMPL family transporter [Verrucomicrobiota bacterium]